VSGKPQSARRASRALPFVTLKAAMTLDGRTAARDGESKWITSEDSRKHAHRLRAQSDAVLVGIATVLADDPELSVRHVRGKNPLRVVLDSRLRTPARSKLARVTPKLRTLIFHGPSASARRRAELTRCGVELAQVPVDRRGQLRLQPVLHELAKRGIVQLLVEGGSRVHGALLDAGLAHRIQLFVAPRILGDAAALPLAARHGALRLDQALALHGLRVRRLGPDLLITGDIARHEAKHAK
jgi:diaminohydroxyphosphoribosylaminopyrimidine deaminase/5-amino-6-(5-phosphoribosylamino)uracil reductase